MALLLIPPSQMTLCSCLNPYLINQQLHVITPHLSFQLVPLPLGSVLTYLADPSLLGSHRGSNLHLDTPASQLLHCDELPAPDWIPPRQELLLDIIALAPTRVYPSELTLRRPVVPLVVSIRWVQPQSVDLQFLRFVHRLHFRQFIWILLHCQLLHLHFQQPQEPRPRQRLWLPRAWQLALVLTLVLSAVASTYPSSYFYPFFFMISPL